MVADSRWDPVGNFHCVISDTFQTRLVYRKWVMLKGLRSAKPFFLVFGHLTGNLEDIVVCRDQVVLINCVKPFCLLLGWMLIVKI